MKSTFFTLLVAGVSCAVIPASHAAFSLTDIEFWAGPEAGPGINEAALVIDWNDGQLPMAWGYRWAESEDLTGKGLLSAIVLADPRLDVGGLDSFISHMSYDLDLDGTADRFRPGWDGVSQFWAYYVNNEVFEHPEDLTLNGHVVPPNTEVMPTGDPYDAEDAGVWYQSSTGASDRPVVNGSWDGWIYSDGTVPISEPLAAPIPEPRVAMFLLAALGLLGVKRKRGSMMKTTITKGKTGVLGVALGMLALMASEGVQAEGISADDAKIVAWADKVEQFSPGPVDIRNPEWGNASFGSPQAATGRADAVRENPVQVVSLGDGGSITMEFTGMICEAKGPDFVVFENGFVDTFLEFAFVEVSSDGVHFFRFPSISRTPSDVQNGPFDMLSSSMVDQLAGKYGAGKGTPFDLADLGEVDEELLDLRFVRFVKIIDVVGSIGPHGSVDSKGNIINDPFPTPYLSGGFDLDAIGVINQPEDYPGWFAQYVDYQELPEWTSPESDPDEDERPNFVEYAMGTNPMTGNSDAMGLTARWEKLPTGEEALRVPSFRARPEVEQSLEVSADLEQWETLVAIDDRGFPVLVKEGSYRVALEVEGDASDDVWWLIREKRQGKRGADFVRLGFKWVGDAESED